MNGQLGNFLIKCFVSLDEMKHALKQDENFISEKFADKYCEMLGKLSLIADIARIYTYENWKKVEDWSELSITLTYKRKNITFFKYIEHDHTANELDKSLDTFLKNMHNPVNSVTDFSVDPTDRDTYIKINNKWFFLNDEDVIVIADYIEKSIRQN